MPRVHLSLLIALLAASSSAFAADPPKKSPAPPPAQAARPATGSPAARPAQAAPTARPAPTAPAGVAARPVASAPPRPASTPAAAPARPAAPTRPVATAPASRPLQAAAPVARPLPSAPASRPLQAAAPVARPLPSAAAPSRPSEASPAPNYRSADPTHPAYDHRLERLPDGTWGHAIDRGPHTTEGSGGPAVAGSHSRQSVTILHGPGGSGGSGGHDDSPGGDRPPEDRPDHGTTHDPYTGPRGDDGGDHRPYTGPRGDRPDHRYAHPDCGYVYHNGAHAPGAPRPAPGYYNYSPYYTNWWVHPYYRWQHWTTVVVVFDFYSDPWDAYWVPPYRDGWMWVPGYWDYNYWVPGYWQPTYAAPRDGYVWVQGFWYDSAYIEGYWRPERRVEPEQDWVWVEGYYLEDGTYVWGTWTPNFAGPDGYVWESGFWDGQNYIDGFWRPQYRSGFQWMSAWYDTDGVYQSGYWMPTVDRPGSVWVPGWFDGNEWQGGYWISESQYTADDPNTWSAPTGWDAGWEVGQGWGSGEVIDNRSESGGYLVDPDSAPVRSGFDDVEDVPLAIPVR